MINFRTARLYALRRINFNDIKSRLQSTGMGTQPHLGRRFDSLLFPSVHILCSSGKTVGLPKLYLHKYQISAPLRDEINLAKTAAVIAGHQQIPFFRKYAAATASPQGPVRLLPGIKFFQKALPVKGTWTQLL